MKYQRTAFFSRLITLLGLLTLRSSAKVRERAPFPLKKEGGRVLLAGSMRLPLLLECDRCLEPFSYTLAEEFEIVFEVVAKGKEAGLASEYFCQSSDLDVVYVDEPVVDVFSVLMQQLYLGLPEKRLCRDNCLGFCPDCGADLNLGLCDCGRGVVAAPFSILAKLKDQ